MSLSPPPGARSPGTLPPNAPPRRCARSGRKPLPGSGLIWFQTLASALVATIAPAVVAAEWHVAINGHDADAGSRQSPLRTIQRAADLAQPGDVITVHAGTYRERVNPPRGGTSEEKRIVYQAAPGERVEIKGSQVVTGWTRFRDDVWAVAIPNIRFGEFNPYTNQIRGDWFGPRGRLHHTGAVYLNGDWLTEAADADELLAVATEDRPRQAGRGSGSLSNSLWSAQVDPTNTTIWAQFTGVDPNREVVEINVRPCVFYPARPGRNFITVRGFHLRHAATPWAPPTAEQIALIGTHWSRGWIIESNVISHSVCAGVSLGKHGDAFDNTSANSAEGYVQTIARASRHPNPWDGDHVGHHVVRRNAIAHCEQAGIVGSLGGIFSTITDNAIHDIHVRRLFTGAEMAGIKLHGAIDTLIARNHVYRCNQALWLDWMSQGTRVSANFFHDNADRDFFSEVNHGPYLVDNNLFLSRISLVDLSQGGAFVHNLFAGKLISRPELKRETPFLRPHSTVVAGLAKIEGGEDRFLFNIFIGDGTNGRPANPQDDPKVAGGYGLWVYNFRDAPLKTGGNIHCQDAIPYAGEQFGVAPASSAGANPIVWRRRGERAAVEITIPADAGGTRTNFPAVDSALLGRARISNSAFENPDGSALHVDRDYFGQPRDASRPVPGPFASQPAREDRSPVTVTVVAPSAPDSP